MITLLLYGIGIVLLSVWAISTTIELQLLKRRVIMLEAQRMNRTQPTSKRD